MVHIPYGKNGNCSDEQGTVAVEVQNLVVQYPRSDTPSLNKISLTVSVGTRIALVGQNGAGKSTLLKALVGLADIRSGSIKVLGVDPGQCSHRVAYLPQRGELDWDFPMNVHRLVLTGRYVSKGWFRDPNEDDDSYAYHALETLGLADLGHRQIGELSGGQQQRVLFARALTQKPDLLLLDEPFNAVDAETRDIMSQVIDNLKNEGRTIIASTHHLQDLDARFDAAVYLQDGREVAPPDGAFTGLMTGE
ncbi:MAG: metal ABC transporter ATP-binding protein [Phototrophicaceae bacterium]